MWRRKLLLLLALVVSIYYVNNHQEWHRQAIRAKADNAVVMLTNIEGTSGGTGFMVEARSGKGYILTNDHVCGLGDNTNGVLYVNDDGFKVPVKVLYRSIYTDLCLISPVDYKTPLKIARGYDVGQKMWISGHPMLHDLTLVEGEVVQRTVIKIMIALFPNDENCPKQPKFGREEVNMVFFQMPACVMTVKAVWTTAQISPGNSGSPALDDNGNVIGVAFASGGQDLNRGYIIPLEDVELFLRGY